MPGATNGKMAAWVAVLAAGAARATVVSDNTGATSAGTEQATATRWVAASFTTDSSPHSLTSVSLILSSAGGSARVSVYSDAGLQPGTLVGTLVSPGSYSATAAVTVFSTPGISLAAGSTYWVVLRPTSGTFAWSWTTTNTGSGTGFTRTWGSSDDAGATWWTDDFYQTQMSVVVDGCVAPSVDSQPAGLALCIGQGAAFTVSASGAGTLGYQWRKGGVAISNGTRVSGATTASLAISNLKGVDAGMYDCVVSNCSSTPSSPAALTICAADYDCSGTVTIQDIFGFINGWFSGDPRADFDDSGTVDVQDVFAFVSAWFVGC